MRKRVSCFRLLSWFVKMEYLKLWRWRRRMKRPDLRSGAGAGARPPRLVEATPEMLIDLMRLAAEVLEAEGDLRVLNGLWVSRHVVVVPNPPPAEEAGRKVGL